MPFVNFRTKFRFFSFDFRHNFDVRTFPRWLSERGTKFFWWAIQKIFFFHNLHFGPIRWVPRRFLKISIIYCTEYIFYCKRAILFLSSSKILTPHPPLRPASVSSPRNKGGTHSPGGEGDERSIFWKTREIGLPFYSKICTLWFIVKICI